MTGNASTIVGGATTFEQDVSVQTQIKFTAGTINGSTYTGQSATAVYAASAGGMGGGGGGSGPGGSFTVADLMGSANQAASIAASNAYTQSVSVAATLSSNAYTQSVSVAATLSSAAYTNAIAAITATNSTFSDTLLASVNTSIANTDSIRFGTGALVYPNTYYSGSGSIVGRGTNSDWRLEIQDGNGRVNEYWNALYTGTAFNYIANSEPAFRFERTVDTTLDGGAFMFYTAPGSANGGIITWTQLGQIYANSSVWFSPTGNSANFFIANSGFIGIGTSTPAAGFSFYTTGTASPGSVWSANWLAVGNTSYTNGAAVGIGYDSSAGGQITSVSPNISWNPLSYNAQVHKFYASATSTTTPAFYISSTGNIGIGTSSPYYPLDVYYNANNALSFIRVSNANTGSGNYTGFLATAGSYTAILQANPGGYSGVGTSSATAFNIFSNNNTQMVISSTPATVGIGTSSPLSAAGYGWLTVAGPTNGSIISHVQSGTEYFRTQVSSSSTILNNIASTPLLFYTNNTEYARIGGTGGFVSEGIYSIGQLEFTNGNYNAGWRNDGTTVYLLSSANTYPSSSLGASWNSYRPFEYNLNTGALTLDATGIGLTTGGGITTGGSIILNSGGIKVAPGNWFWTSGSALLATPGSGGNAWVLQSDNATASALQFKNNAGTALGWIYTDTSPSVYLLNSSGNATFRVDNTGNAIVYNALSVAYSAYLGNSAGRNTENDLYFQTGGINNFYFYNNGTAGQTLGLGYCNATGYYVGSAFTVDKTAGAVTFNSSIYIGSGGININTGPGPINWPSGAAIYTDTSVNGPGDVVVRTYNGSTYYYSVFYTNGGFSTPGTITGSSWSGGSVTPTSGSTLQLANGSNGPQIYFGYNSSNYTHAIKTVHNGGSQASNQINFYLWNYGTDATSGLTATKEILSLDATGSNLYSALTTTGAMTLGGTLSYSGTGFQVGGSVSAGMYYDATNVAWRALNVSGSSLYIQNYGGGSSYAIFASGTQTLYGAVNATGNITAYASDKRLKTNIKPISNALNKLSKLTGYTFDWNIDLCKKYDFEPSTLHEHGVIAQEVQKIIPDAVYAAPFDIDHETKTSISGEDYLTVKYEKLVPLLIQAIKEQQVMIDGLEKRIYRLESKTQ